MVVKEYQYKNAIIKICRPELSESERVTQERRINIALQQFGKAMVAAEKNEVG